MSPDPKIETYLGDTRAHLGGASGSEGEGAAVLTWSAFHHSRYANAAIESCVLEDALLAAVGLTVMILPTVMSRSLLRKAADEGAK